MGCAHWLGCIRYSALWDARYWARLLLPVCGTELGYGATGMVLGQGMGRVRHWDREWCYLYGTEIRHGATRQVEAASGSRLSAEVPYPIVLRTP
eukprot:3940461-Rhodomonas_salina.3